MAIQSMKTAVANRVKENITVDGNPVSYRPIFITVSNTDPSADFKAGALVTSANWATAMSKVPPVYAIGAAVAVIAEDLETETFKNLANGVYQVNAIVSGNLNKQAFINVNECWTTAQANQIELDLQARGLKLTAVGGSTVRTIA